MPEYALCPKCGVPAYARDRFSNGHYCFPSQGGCGTKFPIEIKMVNGLYCHQLPINNFLNVSITAFFHDFYISKANGGSPFSELILAIKSHATDDVRNDIANIVREDLKKILMIDFYRGKTVYIFVVPRSKPDSFWREEELQFRSAVMVGIKDLQNVIDGTNAIKRVVETQTTHLAHLDIQNNGAAPYPGITQDTCEFNMNICGKDVILIDDIYTENKGIDEDCIQFLINKKAGSISLYTLGMTKHNM